MTLESPHAQDPQDVDGTLRLRLEVRGAVQGVGFRPFIHRLARQHRLTGWVSNSPQGVTIEVQGPEASLTAFRRAVREEKPAHAIITGLEHAVLEPVEFTNFEIRTSDASGERTTLILPDIATCPDCLRELFDPADRRYLYPFINCTHCGPRYSIIESLPYDRPRTTMKRFPMCAACRAEYENPEDRRFHAQPVACANCGPHIELWDAKGRTVAEREAALVATIEEIRRGRIVAVKGLGGFHLVVLASNPDAVGLLRQRKGREEKPFAVMFPDSAWAAKLCRLTAEERTLLEAPEAPILLLERDAPEDDTHIARAAAPGYPTLGGLLPYTPLHHLLMSELGAPIVATSGNLSDEPICTDEREALERLGIIADAFLVHDRPIARHVDDSIVRVVMGRPQLLRRARGYAPAPVGQLAEPPDEILAVGAHLKNAIALNQHEHVIVSQHIGDLENTAALDAFTRVIADLADLTGGKPRLAVADMHPDYFSTLHAQKQFRQIQYVQHHHAHVTACMLDNQLDGAVLGVSWDGTGLGPDGTIWGGEFLECEGAGFVRIGHLRTFALPGGDQAAREPRRSAIGLLFEFMGADVFALEDLAAVAMFSSSERSVLAQVLKRSLNAHRTSSAGRLFDAVASLLGLRQICRYEGQAAIELEFLARRSCAEEPYPFEIRSSDQASANGPHLVDWQPMIEAILRDASSAGKPADSARRFHVTLAEAITEVARRRALERVVLTGGCFQNVLLTEFTVDRLRCAGFRVYVHQRIPPNDGGIAAGQLAVAAARLREGIPK